MLTKVVIVVALVMMGGIFAARAGQAPRMELEVDIDKRALRRKRLTAEGRAQLVAQWTFDEISGLEIDGDSGRAALFLQSGSRRSALLSGAPDALRDAARRIGSDLLRCRRGG